MGAERQAQQKSQGRAHELLSVESESQPESELLTEEQGQSKALCEPPVHPTAQLMRQVSIRQMQRSFGNSHTQRIISHSFAQRNSTLTSQDRGFFTKSQGTVNKIGASADSRHQKVVSFIKESISALGVIQANMRDLTSKYNSAYEMHKSVLNKAAIVAEDQNFYKDLVLGVVIGVTVGLGFGALEKCRLARNFFKKVGKLAVETIGEMTEAGVSWTNKKVVGEDPETSDFQPTPASDPTGIELKQQEQLNDLYKELINISTETGSLHDISMIALLVSDDINAYLTGGRGKTSISKLHRLCQMLSNLEPNLSQVDKMVAEHSATISRLKKQSEFDVKNANEAEMEQNIWINWIVSLPRDKADKILDINPIEERLRDIHVIGKGSRLETDFGNYYTSIGDTEKAIREARWEAKALKMVGKQGVVESSELARSGSISVDGGGTWRAISESGTLPNGARVQVIGSTRLSKPNEVSLPYLRVKRAIS